MPQHGLHGNASDSCPWVSATDAWGRTFDAFSTRLAEA